MVTLGLHVLHVSKQFTIAYFDTKIFNVLYFFMTSLICTKIVRKSPITPRYCPYFFKSLYCCLYFFSITEAFVELQLTNSSILVAPKNALNLLANDTMKLASMLVGSKIWPCSSSPVTYPIAKMITKGIWNRMSASLSYQEQYATFEEPQGLI